MEESVRSAFDATRDFRGKSFRSACYAPFVSLNFNTRGDVVACCKNQIYVLGNVGEVGLDEIWNGPKVKTLRRAVERYDYGAGCEFCEWQVRAGDYRGVFSRRFDEFEVTETDPRWPTTMEFTISNTCNYECIMCSGELSSSIRARREGLPPMPKVYGDAFFADLRKYLPHLRSAVFMGGEPFLAHENYRIWDMMIEDGSSVPCHVITNGSQWNERVERILDRLPVRVCVSLDGATKDTVESVRLNARFEVVMENVRRFLDSTRRKGTGFSLSYCLMRQNWREFGAFLLLAEGLGCSTWINTVVDPPACSLYSLPSGELAEVVAAMDEEEKDLLPRLRINRQVWLDGVGSLRKQAAEQQGEALARAKSSIGGRSHVAVAWELAGQGRLEEALREVLRTPETYPDYYQSLVARAHFRRRLGDRDGAARDLETALALTRKRPEPYLERAWIHLERGQVDEALADGLRARETLREGDPMEGFVHDLLGLVWCRKGNLEEGLRALDRFAQMCPRNAKAQVHRGWVLDSAGRPAEALSAAGAALEIDPTDAEAEKLRLTAACHLAEQGKVAEALGEIDKASEGDLLRYEALVAAGRFRRLAGDLAGAERDLDRAVETGETRPEAFHERAWLRLERGRLDEGVRDALRARDLLRPNDPVEAGVCHVLGLLWSHTGEFDKARVVLDRLLALRPTDPTVRVHRGWAYDLSGAPREAIVEIEAALALRPDHPEARRLREALARGFRVA